MSQVTVNQAIQMGLEHHRAGRYAEAEGIYRQILAADPRNAEALHLLGAMAGQLGRPEVAVDLIRQAIAINPTSASFFSNLGSFLTDCRRLEEAVEACRRAVQLYPGFADAYYNLGNALAELRRQSEAVEAYGQALRLQPDKAQCHTNLGNVLKDMGRIEEAIGHYRRTVALEPWAAQDHGNLLLAMQYISGASAGAAFGEARRWNELYALPLAKGILPHGNERAPERRLRVGYVSPDFRNHSVAFFIEPLLSAHDREQFEVFCYGDFFRAADQVTARLGQTVPHFREVTRLTDLQLAELIRQDQIDILVDLAGHTAHNRLMVFARKPAPVQVTYLGYPATTGMTAMDYRLTNSLADPPGESDRVHTESLVRLEKTFLCYRPPEDAPASNGLPALEAGYVTFGCFNARPKINSALVSLWSRILQQVPRSRMVIKNLSLSDPGTCKALLEVFAANGISVDRIELRGTIPSLASHLEFYHRVDIALDTYPYHGTTTTCEAMWMSVPVVTLAGETHASRVGVSLLTTVGLTELIARTPDQYVALASGLANDLRRLGKLREGIRGRMKESALLDGPRFAREAEGAYRAMWRQWCAGGVRQAGGKAKD